MIFFVMDQAGSYEKILPAWQEAGAPGVTILRSTGIGRYHRHANQREDLPLFPGLDDLFQQEESQNRTFISVVPDRETVDRIVRVTQEISGDLNDPDSGVLFVLPVLEAYGLVQRDYPAG